MSLKNKHIPYGKHELDDEDIQAVINTLKSDNITQGNTVESFGQELAKYTGAKYGIAVSSGTAALHISVSSLGIGAGDEVITTPMTFCATANAVLYQGAEVKFVDIDADSLNIDPSLIEEKINDRTKAIIAVDFRGHPAALYTIKKIANRYNIYVIEDGSHSIGSTYKDGGKKYMCGDGQHADICTFSFHPVKHITTGEGGAILTNDEKLFHHSILLRKHGIDRQENMFSKKNRIGSWMYDMETLGFNYRITDFQAALGLSQLKKIEKFKARRREIVSYYNKHFSDFEELILPHENKSVESNFHIYVLQIKENPRFDRYDLFTHLQKLNYLPMVHYIPVHFLSYYKKRFGHKRGDFPVAERFYERAISIPLYPSLSDLEVEKVTKDIIKFIK